jgi:hypothetical protein
MLRLVRVVFPVLALVGVLLIDGCGTTDCDRTTCDLRDLYIDDMEDLEDVCSVSLMREDWVPASPPDGFSWQDTRRMWWYVKDREVRREDLYPWTQSVPGEAYIPVLEINHREAMYDWVVTNPDQEWDGLMRLVSKVGSDYSELRFLEVWLRQKTGDGGTMHIDLGAVSENFYHPWAADSLHTEDKDHDGELGEYENTGLDGIPDGMPGDDPDDDWSYSEGDYSHINGMEGDPKPTPDTEDLDSDGNLDTDQVHFGLSFDLSDTTYFAHVGVYGWHHYRLPLAWAGSVGGDPSWRSIRYIRFFFTDVDSPSVFQIAYLWITGLTWREEDIRTKADMAWIEPGDEERFFVYADYSYQSPEYEPPCDPGNESDGYPMTEKSMVFSFEDLAPGNCGAVHRQLPDTQDLTSTSHENVAFYVRGGQYASTDDVYMFVRIGTDSLNFYEIGVAVTPGWQAAEVPLAELSAVGAAVATVQNLYGTEVTHRAIPRGDGWIGMYGGPSLTRVEWLGAGVMNAANASAATTGKVLFDDLRLTD